MTKERPILFSAQMVRALLDDRKTQTRRIVKGPAQGAMNRDDPREEEDGGALWIAQCPLGQPSDRLWVREAWSTLGIFDKKKPSDMDKKYLDTIRYKADGVQSGKLRPSMFMPRWASRITLEIVSIRVERLQEIGEEDALAEGVVVTDGHETNARLLAEGRPDLPRIAPAQQAYCELWESINGPGSWEKNPWVWVIDFRR